MTEERSPRPAPEGAPERRFSAGGPPGERRGPGGGPGDRRGGPGDRRGGPGGPGGDRRRRGGPRGRFPRRKVCPFCADKMEHIDHKDVVRLRRFVNDRGKMMSRRLSGACAKHQRKLTRAIKRARQVALLPHKNA